LPPGAVLRPQSTQSHDAGLWLTLRDLVICLFTFMLMEDAMPNPDNNSLYVLICSLAATVISLPAVWYFAAAAYATPGLIA
jgi:hypothetical protein